MSGVDREKTAAVLEQAAEALASLTERCGQQEQLLAEKEEKLAHYARLDKARGIVRSMSARGMVEDGGFDAKVAALVESDQNLDVLEQAVALKPVHLPFAKVASISGSSGVRMTESDLVASLFSAP